MFDNLTVINIVVFCIYINNIRARKYLQDMVFDSLVSSLNKLNS